jgi:4-hydroxybenzoate polyprenyltransferase
MAAPILSFAFARDYAVTMRPYLLFVSGITGMTGLALAPRLPLAATALLCAVFFLSYGFGQALTDCTQLDTDALSSPYRPLVRGTIGVKDVLWVSLAGLLVAGAILILFNPWTVPLVTLSVIGLGTYTTFKRRWWAGPFYNAAIVGMLLLIGYAAGGGDVTGVGLGGALPATLGLAFFGYANFVLTGYFKDISADRKTDYATLPVRFGRRWSAVVSDAFALLAVACCAIALRSAAGGLAPTAGGIVVFLAFSAGVLATVLGQIRLHRVRSDEDAHEAIVPVVHAYLLLLISVAALHQPGWSAFLVGFYVLFGVTMSGRPEQTQI